MRYSIGDDEMVVAADEESVYDDMLTALSGDGDYFDDEAADLVNVMGLDEIVGVDEIIGADSPAKSLRATKKKVAALAARYSQAVKQIAALKRVAAAKAAGGVVLRRQAATRPPKDQILPVGPQAYLAAQTADVVLIPQRTFRPQRLVFSSLITPFFTMNSLLVGQDPQFVAGGSVPLEVLSQVGVGVGITGTTANLGNTITIGLTNLDAVNAQTVRGAIFGTTVY